MGKCQLSPRQTPEALGSWLWSVGELRNSARWNEESRCWVAVAAANFGRAKSNRTLESGASFHGCVFPSDAGFWGAIFSSADSYRRPTCSAHRNLQPLGA